MEARILVGDHHPLPVTEVGTILGHTGYLLPWTDQQASPWDDRVRFRTKSGYMRRVLCGFLHAR